MRPGITVIQSWRQGTLSTRSSCPGKPDSLSVGAFRLGVSSPCGQRRTSHLETGAKELWERLQDALGSTYTLERELAGGGMSRVFVAREATLGRHVVVKVLPPDAASMLSAERFKREIALVARLQHPHIVPVLAAGVTTDGLPFYTMPLVEGESLRARLDRAGELAVPDAVSVLKD